jgi:hypothetical protein
MLPSFRLIAATFFCGFLIVFAGLRLAASLNDMHEGLPVMAAHAAPIPAAPAADRDARRAASSVPVMYDLRFAVTPVSPTLVRSGPTIIEYPKPALPLAIVPTEIEAKADAESGTDVASIDRDADVAPAQTAAEPVAAEPATPETIEPPAAPAASEETIPEPKTAAVEPLATPAAEPTPQVAEPETTQSVDVPIPAQDITKDKPPAATAPAPKVETERARTPAKAAAAKLKPIRRPHIRTARRAAPTNAFDINNPSTQPFGSPVQTR